MNRQTILAREWTLSDVVYSDPAFRDLSDASDIATYIHDNRSSLMQPDNAHAAARIHQRITHNARIIKDLVTYEMLNYVPATKTMNMHDTYELINALALRYQRIVGGFDIEDTHWTLDTDMKFQCADVAQDYIAVYNSCPMSKSESYDTESFVHDFGELIVRCIDASRLTVYRKYIDNEDLGLCWIVFFVVST